MPRERIVEPPGFAQEAAIAWMLALMTARAQKFKLLGAVGTIIKPFDPLTLAALVRGHLHAARFDTAGDHFLPRLRTAATTLADYRQTLSRDPISSVALEGLQSFAHKSAGAAGLFGFQEVSLEASSLEESFIDTRAGRGAPGATEARLDALLVCLASKSILGSGGRAALLLAYPAAISCGGAPLSSERRSRLRYPAAPEAMVEVPDCLRRLGWGA